MDPLAVQWENKRKKKKKGMEKQGTGRKK